MYQRIVCLTEETVETLYLLGEERRIAGVSGYAVRPPQVRREKPRVSAFISADVPKILALDPDLVLTFSDLQADIAAELIRKGVAVHAFNQRDVAGIFAMIRTLGALVVLLGGLAAYLYYVDAEKPIGETEEKPKVFAVEADQIEELKVSTIAGGVAELKKSADGWHLTSPQQIRADDSEVTGITSNLASVSIQRVVDENPSKLGDYGLREPVAEVSFKTKGAGLEEKILEQVRR